MSTATVGRFAPIKSYDYTVTGKLFGKTSCPQKTAAAAGNMLKLLANLVIGLLNGGISLLNKVFKVPVKEEAHPITQNFTFNPYTGPQKK